MGGCQSRPLNRREIMDVLHDAPFCMLAMSECNQPYVIPMYYDVKYEHGKICFKLFSRECGLKIRFMRRNCNVCLEFQTFGLGVIRTVVVKGRVVKIKNRSRCPRRDEGFIIEIVALCITGREFRLFPGGRLFENDLEEKDTAERSETSAGTCRKFEQGTNTETDYNPFEEIKEYTK